MAVGLQAQAALAGLCVTLLATADQDRPNPGLEMHGQGILRRLLDAEGKPEETERVFVDGWFRTGDIVTVDEKGFVRIVDRIKELIITGGFNVAPTEVEIALRQHPGVEDAAVVGLPSEHSGEEVVAAIVVSPGADVDVEAVREFARGILTAYKVPRRIFVVDELPKSLIGKVLRRQVRDALIRLNSGE